MMALYITSMSMHNEIPMNRFCRDKIRYDKINLQATYRDNGLAFMRYDNPRTTNGHLAGLCPS